MMENSDEVWFGLLFMEFFHISLGTTYDWSLKAAI